MVSVLCLIAPYASAFQEDTLHTTFIANTLFHPKHILTVSLGGGLHAFMHKVSDEGVAMAGLGHSVGAGGQVQATYTYLFHKYVGVTGGLGFEAYTGNMNGSFLDQVYHYDAENGLYRYLNRDFKDFKEHEQLYMLTIPVGIMGRVSFTDRMQLRGTAGVGANIVAGSHYRADGHMEATADYPIYNLHFDADLPQHGLSNYYLHGYDGKIQNTFPINMFVFGDIGVNYQLTKRWGIYAGVYVSYTIFNAVRPTVDAANQRLELIDYDIKAGQWSYSGIINSKFVDALNPLAVGIKIGVTITYLSPIHCNCEDI